MRNYFTLFGIVFLVFLSAVCKCQKSFEYGYYVNQKGDTIKGYAAVEKMHAVFKFKAQLQDNNYASVYFDSCKVIAFKDDSYANWFGKRSMSFLDKIDFSIVNTDSSITGKILLKLLYKGSRLSLYYFRDEIDHFFLEAGDSIVPLIIKYRYLNESEKFSYTGGDLRSIPHHFIQPVYRNQIMAAMGGVLTKKQKAKLEIAEFDKSSLVRLFKVLNAEK